MKYLLLLSLIFININLFSQSIDENNLLKENRQKLELIEEKFEVKFFYKDSWLKETKLNTFEIKDDISTTLSDLLENTDIMYYIYQDKNIVLTNNRNLDLSYKGNRFSDEREDIKVQYSLNDDDRLRQQLRKEEIEIRRIGVPGGKESRVLLSGNISDVRSGQSIQGVAVIADDGKIGSTSDKNGNYMIVLPKGYHVIHYRHVAMESTIRQIELYSGGKVNVSLIQKVTEIGEVTILGEDEIKEREFVGFEMLKSKDFEELPTFMGEIDIIKHSLLLPGIQSSGEGDMSFSVRGGRGDQNLILLEGMHTYSHSHFFGFFPGVNPNTINKANLYKASLPIEFGNRISSVYDIRIKSGNFSKFTIEGGVSPITGNLAMSTPVIKDKLSISVAGRSTYSNWVFDKFNIKELEKSAAAFYDYQGKVEYRMGENSSLSLFYYNSYDDFTLNESMSYLFYNEIGSINWNYTINNKTSISTIAGLTNYKSQREEFVQPEYAGIKEQSLSDLKINSKLTYDLNYKNTISTGIEAVYHQINPWSLEKMGDESVIQPISVEQQKAILGSVFLNNKHKINDIFNVELGLRYSLYSLQGPYDEYVYSDNIVTTENITDTITHKTGESGYFNSGLDVRFTGTYRLTLNQNINFGYNRNKQYIHLLTNSQGVTPTDSWQLSNKYITPQIGNIFSLGYNIDIKKNEYFASVDLYYKTLKDIKDFIDGSEFEYNSHPETEIVDGIGKSYGIEFMIKKNTGRLSGWISYTYSRALIKADSEIERKIINDGDYYAASNDKPHNLSAIINLEPTRRLVFSNVFNFSSGIPITLPESLIKVNDTYTVIYSDRNKYRTPNYFRWDLSLTYKGNLKKKKINGTWTLSIINVTGRDNVYSIYYSNAENYIQGYELSIFASPIPTLTYKFKF